MKNNNQFLQSIIQASKNVWIKTKQMISKMIKAITAFFSNLSKEDYIMYSFYLLILLAMLNVTIMTLHLLDKDYQYPILNHSYISAIAPDQDVNAVMYTDIVKISEFDDASIQVGDKVVIYTDFNITENWVEDVISINHTSKTVTLTYDDATAITVSFDKIIGVYEKDANIFGTLYFTAKFPQGYTLLLISHAFVLFAYYFAWVDKRE